MTTSVTAKAELLDLLLEATNDGIVDWNLVTGDVTYNPRWKHVLGFDSEEFTEFNEHPNLWQELLHPEDSAATLKSLKDHLEQNWPFSMTVRMRHRCGGFRHILCRGAAHRDADDKPLRMVIVFADIDERIRVEEQQRALAAAVPDTIFRARADGMILALKRGTERPGSPFLALVEGQTLKDCLLHEAHRKKLEQALALNGTSAESGAKNFELTTAGDDGSPMWHEIRVVRSSEDESICIVRDMTDQRALEQRLLQSQKLEAIGHLAAGVAHEINTPIQFIGSNLHFAEEAVVALLSLIDALKGIVESGIDAPLDASAREQIQALEETADLEYARTALPTAVTRSLVGVDRVATIVRAMKSFAHPGSHELAPTDLKGLIESTVTVATNEWKYVADVELKLDASMPLVSCIGSELNQVILNLIVNACHAISDVVQDSGNKGLIVIETCQGPSYAEIRITDSGTGIPEHARSKVFDPFFTTKTVGKGTGQGLSMAHACIVGRHKGTLHFETEIGRGTTFFIRLPLNGAVRQATVELRS
ncbi:MAG TPA: ATP-binding protein [Polyangiaceae bacterium]|nr:ATP-binding protein [Polyangiaceae bacterium]